MIRQAAYWIIEWAICAGVVYWAPHWFGVIYFAACFGTALGLVRPHIVVTSAHQIGVIVQFSTCGCKHVDLALWFVLLRFDFGRCRGQ
jgi:hypothetical protein